MPDTLTAPSIVPYLTVTNALRLIDFLKCFDASVISVIQTQEHVVSHAEVRIGNSVIYLHEELPMARGRSPIHLGGTTVSLTLITSDVDALFERAVAAGARPDSAPADGFWGDRYARVTDPSGHAWTLSTPQEEIPTDEQQRRANVFFAHSGH